jgi:hypothetical protein
MYDWDHKEFIGKKPAKSGPLKLSAVYRQEIAAQSATNRRIVDQRDTIK